MMRKVILMIADSLGVGALPDADKYGDQGADTFGHIVREMEAAGTPIRMPNLLALGWGNIDGVCGGKLTVSAPAGCYGKLAELSAGNDTTTGHWEIAGL
ncbi:MAG: phosphopentomutase, partial [Firmicutes bacterium]|nr:phosphopentomutase [Bacillota bacterium]